MPTTIPSRPAKKTRKKPTDPTDGVVIAYVVRNLQCASCSAPMKCLPVRGAWPYCSRGCGRVKLIVTPAEGGQHG